jgi:hypothetical protein
MRSQHLGVLANDGSRSGPIAAFGLRFRSSFTRVNSGPVLALPCSVTGLRADFLRYSVIGFGN